ncbi:pantoate--beta-alanine ligase [Lysinibacillus sp. RS5]
MKVVTTIQALTVEIQAAKQAQKTIGLVPTMGN